MDLPKNFTLDQAKEKLKEHWIKQLYKWETLRDTLDFVEWKRLSRVWYKVRTDSWRWLSENEIKREWWKEAFWKTVIPKEYKAEYVEDREDAEDLREEDTKWVLTTCAYCGAALLVDDWYDKNWKLYDDYEPPVIWEIHCEWCMSNAIWSLTM